MQAQHNALVDAAEDAPESEPSPYPAPILYADLPEAEPLKWCVDGLIYRGGICMFVGRPKCGKTGAALTLAAKMSSGAEEFFGRQLYPGPVLYLDYENPRNLTRTRLDRLHTDGGYSLEYLYPLLGERPQPNMMMSMLRLCEAMEHAHPTIVFLDGLMGFAGIEDLNNYAEVYPAFTELRRAAEAFDCAIVLMHHGRKSGGSQGDQSAGSVAIPGQCDVMLSFEAHDDYSRFEVHTDCLREGEPIPRSIVTMGDGGQSELFGTVAKA